MEKIRYAPLTEHLQQQRAYYNGLYSAQELRTGPADGALLQRWIGTIIQPIVRELTVHDLTPLPKIFGAFFAELLRLTGSGELLLYEREYEELWQVCMLMPGLAAAHPAKLLRSLNSGIKSVRQYAPDKTHDWIALLKKTVHACGSIEDLRHCGRFTAWFCGLAHLHGICRKELPGMPSILVEILEECSPVQKPLNALIAQNWLHRKEPEFVACVGGFTGHGGAFSSPPMVSESGGYVVAADGSHTALCFADEFGQLLLPQATATKFVGDTSSLQAIRAKVDSGSIPFDDISSCVLKNNTAFLTRFSSHFIYVYGWNETN